MRNGMKKSILIILGIISALYGIVVLQVGSGTLFWLLWEVIGVFVWIWAVLLHKDFFARYRKIKTIFGLAVAIGGIVLAALCGMIVGDFSSAGEQNLDYIIVLGAQVYENGPSAVLQYRLDTAVEYLNENPNTRCIVSGGQGENEPFSEAVGMAEYLIKQGVGAERILLEEQSANTAENIKYSKLLIKEFDARVGIITNNFHVFRAIQIAKTQGMKDICGIAADSNALYLPNNVLRECCGILKDVMVKNIKLGCNKKSMNYIIGNEPSITGIVKKTNENAILIENNNGEYWVSLNVENEDSMTSFHMGDEVVVYYDGNVAESYPMQINTVYAITLKTPADRKENNKS